MSLLTVHHEDAFEPYERYTDHLEVAERLRRIGVLFERWKAEKPLSKEATEEDILEAYAGEIRQLNERFGFQSVDVIAVTPDHPKREELRQQFLKEHTHGDFEIRFFVEGKGIFYLHPDDGHVYIVLCEAGDLISVPAGVKHWFDMGGQPSLKVIRFFTIPEGWKANFTGSDIAEQFPKMEEYCKRCA